VPTAPLVNSQHSVHQHVQIVRLVNTRALDLILARLALQESIQPQDQQLAQTARPVNSLQPPTQPPVPTVQQVNTQAVDQHHVPIVPLVNTLPQVPQSVPTVPPADTQQQAPPSVPHALLESIRLQAQLNAPTVSRVSTPHKLAQQLASTVPLVQSQLLLGQLRALFVPQELSIQRLLQPPVLTVLLESTLHLQAQLHV
jgi:hypothetical protein